MVRSIAFFMSVHSCVSKTTSKLHKIFCTCYVWPWLSPLMTLQYDVYLVLWTTSCFSHNECQWAKTTEAILRKGTDRIWYWLVGLSSFARLQPEARPVLADCRLINEYWLIDCLAHYCIFEICVLHWRQQCKLLPLSFASSSWCIFQVRQWSVWWLVVLVTVCVLCNVTVIACCYVANHFSDSVQQAISCVCVCVLNQMTWGTR